MSGETLSFVGEKPPYVEAALSTLGYQENGEWVALALETDLRGYGETWDEALDDLRDVVLAQISFGDFKGELEMTWRRAGEEYWERFRHAQRALLAAALTADKPSGQPEFHAGALAVPPAHVIAAHRDRFQPADS